VRTLLDRLKETDSVDLLLASGDPKGFKVALVPATPQARATLVDRMDAGLKTLAPTSSVLEGMTSAFAAKPDVVVLFAANGASVLAVTARPPPG